jgi:outer membrane lipoprotein-sorting protein
MKCTGVSAVACGMIVVSMAGAMALIPSVGRAEDPAEKLPQTRPSDSLAQKSLEGHLEKLKDVRTLEVQFVCQRQLATVDAPLVCAGRMWMRKGARQDAKDGVGGALRISTEAPFVSELILADGKIYGRSQHESEWTVTAQAARPGLTAVMVQLGAWSTGDTVLWTQMYAVTGERNESGDAGPQGAAANAIIPQSPAVGGLKSRAAGDGRPLDIYMLAPGNSDLAAIVKSIQLAIDRESSMVQSIEITTVQGDVTRYWFFEEKANDDLSADLFKPRGDLPVRLMSR